MLSDLFRKAFDGDGVVFGNQAEDGFFRFTQLYSNVYSSVFPFALEPAPVERDRRGYRGRAETIGLRAVFPDDLGDAVLRLLDEPEFDKGLDQGFVHRLVHPSEEILFSHVVSLEFHYGVKFLKLVF